MPQNKWKIIVKHSTTTLDDVERTLHEEDLMICDERTV
jgi:hypothetical protein